MSTIHSLPSSQTNTSFAHPPPGSTHQKCQNTFRASTPAHAMSVAPSSTTSHKSTIPRSKKTSNYNNSCKKNNVDSKSYASSFKSNQRQSRASGFSTKSAGASRDGRNIIATIVEGRGTGAEIGMCFCDLRTSEVILSQVSRSNRYSNKLIHMIEAKILMFCDNGPQVDFRLIHLCQHTIYAKPIPAHRGKSEGLKE